MHSCMLGCNHTLRSVWTDGVITTMDNYLSIHTAWKWSTMSVLPCVRPVANKIGPDLKCRCAGKSVAWFQSYELLPTSLVWCCAHCSCFSWLANQSFVDRIKNCDALDETIGFGCLI